MDYQTKEIERLEKENKALIDSAEALMELLRELHQEEIDQDHFEDDATTCSYCIEIEKAKKVLGI